MKTRTAQKITAGLACVLAAAELFLGTAPGLAHAADGRNDSGHAKPPQNQPASPQNQAPTMLAVGQQGVNLSAGNLDWSDSVQAEPNDLVGLQITIRNNGDKDATQVNVSSRADDISYTDVAVNDVTVPGDITSGITIPRIAAGQIATVTLQGQVAGDSAFRAASTTIANVVTVTGSDSSTPVVSSDVSFIITKPPQIASKSPPPPAPQLIAAGALDRFRSVFSSVFGPSDLYQYVGLPKWANTILIVIGGLAALASVMLLSGVLERYVKPLFKKQ